VSYGCYNRRGFEENVETVSVEPILTPACGGFLHTPKVVSRTWPNRFAQDCQYTSTALGQADPKCAGCKHRKEIK